MAKRELERRFTATEVRLESSGKIKGMIPYESLSVNLGDFKEVIARNAFSKSLNKNADIKALFNHNENQPLARTSTGSLQLRNTNAGLEISISPNETSWAKDCLAATRSGDVSGFSFGFYVDSYEWSKDKNGESIRTVSELDLIEVSPVFDPAYQKSEISLRAKKEVRKMNKEIVEDDEKEVEEVEENEDSTDDEVEEKTVDEVKEEMVEVSDGIDSSVMELNILKQKLIELSLSI